MQPPCQHVCLCFLTVFLERYSGLVKILERPNNSNGENAQIFYKRERYRRDL